MNRRTFLAASLVSAVAACAQPAPPAPRTIVVFFTANSVDLDADAQSAIKQAAVVARATPSTPVYVSGSAAPDAGTPAFNKSLSQTRAQAVADALVAAGVAPARLRLQSRGAVPYDLQPTESRRVEIVIG